MDLIIGIVLSIIDWLDENTLLILPALTFWCFYRRPFAVTRVEAANRYLEHVSTSETNETDFHKIGILSNIMKHIAEITESLRTICAALMAILCFIILYALK